MKRQRAEEWAEAKKRCRLSDEALQMAKELGFAPRGLIKNIPAKSERWKQPVEDWVRSLYQDRFGKRRPQPVAPYPDASPPVQLGFANPERNLLREAEEALLSGMENETMDAEEFAHEMDSLQRNIPVSEGEIEEQNQYALSRQRTFSEAAHVVAAGLAGIPSVQKVVLFGSVAKPPYKEVPRFRRLRRAGIEVFHECKDLDLAVWLSDFADLRTLKKAAARALSEWYRGRPNSPGVAHHQVDTFLFDAATNEFRGNLCHYGECPKGKRECAVPHCGDTQFVQIRPGLTLRPDALSGGIVLFDRASGLLLDAPQEDDIPF